MTYESSLCSGCGLPRHESMARENEEQYRAEAIQCHACAVRDRKARNDVQNENTDTAGRYYAIVDDRE